MPPEKRRKCAITWPRTDSASRLELLPKEQHGNTHGEQLPQMVDLLRLQV
jgi:hypothetical protein